ncbi:type IV secretory system conjugative DNA transfer family protein [Candidatus Parcubacteria bacterium]|nr:type IV secretory system conjugative DNA transfer family protein [Candidatus Parcubacteria bacterium]
MDDIIIGYNIRARDREVSFAKIQREDRRHHKYVIGKSGTGKSTLIKNMAIQDMRAGEGVAVIDPHGDLIEDLLNHIPKSRTNDVVYFNPADLDFPCGFNILEAKGDKEKELVASALISVFKHIWRDFWGPRTEYVLYNTVAALLDWPQSTLAHVYQMLSDKRFRGRVVERIQDPMVRLFWVEVFASWSERFAGEVVSPIQNKVGQLLAGPMLRNIICRPKSSFDMREIIDQKKILLVNLSKGRIGENRADLLGSVIVTKLYLAALARQTVKEQGRSDFYVYVDEFQSFATDAFASMLSEARKYRLNLILAHQYLDQISNSVRQAVFGNVGTMIVFRTGSADAQILEKEFAPYYELEDLRIQPNYAMIYKLIVGGIAARPDSAQSLPLIELIGNEAKKDTVIKVSRQRYGRKNKV